MIGYIYKLVCPISKQPVYIGYTLISLEKRLGCHLAAIKTKKNSPLCRYFYQAKSNPQIELVKKVYCKTVLSIKKHEQKVIDEFRRNGFVLLNKNKTIAEVGKSVKVSYQLHKDILEHIKGRNITISDFSERALVEEMICDNQKENY